MTSKRKSDSIYVTRYMGAKYKLLDFIVPKIEEMLEPKKVLIDAMAGTHSVGYALKHRNTIVANDIQYYSEIFGKALLLNNDVLRLKSRFYDDFKFLESSKYKNSWFTRTYGDTYFSKKQCSEIVAIRDRISNISNENVQAVYLTVLANAMSICQSSSGHFAQYFPKEHPRIQVLRGMSILNEFEKKCLELQLKPGIFRNHVFRMNVNQFLDSTQICELAHEGSVVYLDPPYSTAQYSRYYHLLETVFLNDEPEVNFKGLYRGDRFQSEFCSPKYVQKSFRDVIKQTSSNGWNLVISYSDAGLMNLSDLQELCFEYYKSVEIFSKSYEHSTQGRGSVSKVNEVVVACGNLR